MKIGLTSDIHLEFGDWYPVNPEGADVLVLSGDILVAKDLLYEVPSPYNHKLYGTEKSERFHAFLANCKKEWKEVIYVMGNHEHYNGDFAKSADTIREVTDRLGIHFLDKQIVKIDDVTFVGGTLWTDMNARDDLTMYTIRTMMNDFRLVRNSAKVAHFKDMDGKFHTRESRFTPEDAVEDHEKFLEYIRTVIEGKNDEKFVVVGHHAPSRKSTHPRYANDTLMNGGYSSHLDFFIEDHPQIKLWTHGHTHEPFDYTIGQTRILCNPRGYVGHERLSNEVEPYYAKVVYI